MRASSKFQRAWRNNQISKPVVILIGGYAGTGKSTLATRIAKQMPYTQTIPTGIFRSIAQTQTDVSRSPALFSSTYDLHTMYGQNNEGIIRAFNEQCAPVSRIIHSVVSFMAVEKQHLIIEGNHVLPWEHYQHTDCHIIELYLYVEDEARHFGMLGGPTHNRAISKEQFTTGRIIHDALRSGASRHEKALFECRQTAEAEAFVQHELARIFTFETSQGTRHVQVKF